MEIGRLSGDPAQELRHCRMRAQGSRALAVPRQLDIAEIGMDRPVAHRMQRDDDPPAAAPGHRMMPLAAPSERAFAKPTSVDLHPFGTDRLISVLAH
jgi:hypothetical protein